MTVIVKDEFGETREHFHDVDQAERAFTRERAAAQDKANASGENVEVMLVMRIVVKKPRQEGVCVKSEISRWGSTQLPRESQDSLQECSTSRHVGW